MRAVFRGGLPRRRDEARLLFVGVRTRSKLFKRSVQQSDKWEKCPILYAVSY
jgi:hypothetical protein